jgi:SPRY domain/Concanavalin A-like lectin/glucanases superfamily
MSLLSRLAVQAARAYGILSSRSTNISADYLVVAGGGAGGENAGGGGGAGGYKTSTFTLSTLNTYSIAVGAGGALGASTLPGGSGTNSSVSGTGLSTVTSTGGGGGGALGYPPGGYNTPNGVSGGSGGGGGGGYGGYSGGTGGAGTAGQGNNGGTGFNGSSVPTLGGAGGGGASATGNNGTSGTGGAGGAGTASSISGSSVTYAGGGGGGGATGGAGGSGGGGTGGYNSGASGVAGTANTGGGGGGGGNGSGTGTGGSGIVIISYTSATPKFVGGTITTSGGKQIHTFTSSGTLSPITPITASYLVVAGGGGGGTGSSGGQGGGGAGGLLTNSTTLYSGATYVVTVGGGGAQGVNGSNSVVSGTGLTTLTATGGGLGASGSFGTGGSGGSGGGGSEGNNPSDGGNGGAGTSGQGSNGGKGAGGAGGGGGGASAVGGNAAGAGGAGVVPGNGGAGTSSSISGTSVTYAGGGGGSGYGPYTPSSTGAGGAGGGGAGASGQNGSVATPGTPNTGGGGGAKNTSGSGSASGGSGIVIISYAGSQQFNGGLVTTSGGNTIHTFTSTGALTPLTNNLNNSLRFRSSASAYLSRTPTLAGNRNTWTFSAWVKKTPLASGVQAMIAAGVSTTVYDDFCFENDQIRFVFNNGTYDVKTTQVFRDPSAWYHIVVAMDTTQATAANRTKIYVNGNQVTAFATANYPAQNHNTNINNTILNTIGNLYNGSFSSYFDGYMTDINFIDGQALEPYYFGNNDANGVWKPIQYKGTYGTNGFYLTFGNTTSTTTLGYDSSPNGNNWTCNNISLTAGTTYDAMTDVPTNTSATVANYPVYDQLIPANVSGSGVRSISAANLYVTNSGPNGWSAIGTTMVMTSGSGKWYWEVTCSGTTSNGTMIGIHRPFTSTSTFPSAIIGYDTPPDPDGYGYYMGGNKYNNSGAGVAYGASYTAGDVIGVALDMSTAGSASITFYKNNTSQGVAFSSLTGDFFAAVSQAQANGLDINFGQRPFAYTPPTGFVRLNTFNLPTPTILQGNKYMDATTWTGNGPASQVIVNQGQFKPDMVWVKNRSSTRKHNLYDSVRGVAVGASYRLVPDDTAAQDNPMYGVTSMNSNGFTIGEEGDVNANGLTFVGWQWQAGQGSTSSNTNGSITSTVSVNTTAGFSIVTYTGTGANATVGHGLGVAPSMVIVKSRTTAENWMVYHTVTGATQYIYLDSNGAAVTLSTIWNNTAPTSSVFSIGTNVTVNQSSTNYVAYCWAEISGFSKFGSFIGNSSTNGPFVYCGFRPRYILFKNTTSYDWHIFDAARNTYNLTNSSLKADTTGAEYTNDDVSIDLLSNGFKLRGTDLAINGPSNTIIFAAFAEHPFKNANAR